MQPSVNRGVCRFNATGCCRNTNTKSRFISVNYIVFFSASFVFNKNCVKQVLSYCLFFIFSTVATAQKIVSITIDGTINPVSAAFIKDAIDKAGSEKAECLIIHLNTPGGLLQSTRMIVTGMLESPVPVIVYVSPGGAHAGSAGVFLTLAANIAAMAPGTNIGAAHPVALQSQMDTTMNEKVTNDAAAFIRTIAEKRHRNMQWADRAVRRSYSYTETEALQDSVIDLIAKNDQDLLIRIDGMKVELNTGTKILSTRGAVIDLYKMSVWERILNIISDPTFTYLLLMLGIYGIVFELFSPGAIFPGIVGFLALILAFYSMQILPVNYAGLALIIFAVILFLLEIKIVSHGLLAIGGTVSLLLGSMMLMRQGTSYEFARISRFVIYMVTALSALFFLFVIGAGLSAQRRKVSSMAGSTAEAIEALDPTGTVKLHGEIWNAESVGGSVKKGELVRIKERKALKLYVEPLHNT